MLFGADRGEVVPTAQVLLSLFVFSTVQPQGNEELESKFCVWGKLVIVGFIIVTWTEFEATVVPQLTKHLNQVVVETVVAIEKLVWPFKFVHTELSAEDCH